MISSKRKPVSTTLRDSDVLTIGVAAELLRCHTVTIKRNADVLPIPFRSSCCPAWACCLQPKTSTSPGRHELRDTRILAGRQCSTRVQTPEGL